MDEIFDFKTVCRICLENKEAMISIFDDTSNGILFSEMLQECTSVFVSHNDQISKNLCVECSEQLQANYKFKLKCIRSDNLLKDSAAETDVNLPSESDSIYIIIQDESDHEHNDNEDASMEEVFIKSEQMDSDSDSMTRTSYQCEECGIEFQLEQDFISHLKFEHEKDTRKCLGNTYTCNTCHKVYSSEHGLKKHLISHGQCKYCDQSYDDDTKLLQHIEEHRRIGFTCNECGKKFKNFVRFKMHTQMNSNGVRFKCTPKKNLNLK